jgi:YCII-related domain
VVPAGDGLVPPSPGGPVQREGEAGAGDQPGGGRPRSHCCNSRPPGCTASEGRIGGFDLINCADLDKAIEAASKHPVARLGVIEVRPLWQD